MFAIYSSSSSIYSNYYRNWFTACSVVVVIWAHWERQGPKGARGNDPIDAPTRPFGPGILACDQPRSSHSMGIPRYRIRDALVCTVYIYDIYGMCVCIILYGIDSRITRCRGWG